MANGEEVTSELSPQHKLMEKHLKKVGIVSSIISISIGVLAALGVTYGFYYTTKHDILNNTTEINEVKENQKEIIQAVNDMAVYKGVSEESITGLKEDMKSMDEKLDLILYYQKQ
jgi:hypothetical protein